MKEHGERRRGVDNPLALFIRASEKYPASVTAQAAFIAQECKAHGIQPIDMHNQFAARRDYTTKAYLAAKFQHEKHGVPTNGLTHTRVKEIALGDFKLAALYVCLHPQEITDILRKYQYFQQLDPLQTRTDPELLYREYASNVVLTTKPGGR